ncbi:MAG: formyltetrahydrofolate deformylase [Myxococcales bacterium]|nr:formyltetrahydrofolate deformylase [Myxococcales bacterium]MCB9707987.1 formyltetrahydrofolate deformylase [Myxococcales bacterium]
MRTATLLIYGRDRPGLVAEISKLIFRHGGNILHADQHIVQEQGLFLQRIEWDLTGFVPNGDEVTDVIKKAIEPLGMEWSLRFSAQLPKVAICVSKHAHCLYELLARWKNGELGADIRVVLSNHSVLQEVADRFSVPFLHCPIIPGRRSQQEQQLRNELERCDIDLVVLARYMQILSEELVSRYPNRIINIHHSFLPAFPGVRPYHRAHERGVKIIGATAHYVTEALDEGPIIEQDVVRVSHRDSVQDLVAKGRDLEKLVLARAVAYHVSARVLVYGNRTVVFR